MEEKNSERLLKIIEDKKKLASEQGFVKERATKKMGNNRKGFNNKKSGGLFDK